MPPSAAVKNDMKARTLRTFPLNGYPELRVVIDSRGSSYRCATWVEAVQLQSLNPGSVITQKDDAESGAWVVKGADDAGTATLF